MLSACKNAPPLPAAQVITLSCPAVTRCQLPASNPTTNGELLGAKEKAETAWGLCAAKVDVIVDCQEKLSEKARFPAPVHQ
ncbi:MULTISPECIES: Rz1-like lysis system protein LysC [Enterobacter]|uniref:Rz1-like lysis system protein LysC n=1 Tax=Enterobacter TaxID=547 RepID=UPI002012835D|nr:MULTISPECIES: Rz1-like lysis system protein LysC [Enterobacter]